MGTTCMPRILWLALLLLASAADGRRGGGGGFGGGRGGSRFGSSSSRGTASRGSSFTMSGRPRTSLYARSAFTGRRQSVNSNGFGLGLGVGMLIGYRPGFLMRPYGYRDPSHTYGKEHEGQAYNRRPDGLIECAVADTVNYVKRMSDYQDVESEEESEVCGADEDLCYATMSVSNVNLTLTDGGEVDLLEVRVVKGCGSSLDFNRTDSPVLGAYSASRRCWTTRVHEESVALANVGNANLTYSEAANAGSVSEVDLATVTVFDFSDTRGMREELDLPAGVSSNGKLSWQSETCVCDAGDLCNAAATAAAANALLAIALLMAFMVKSE